MRAIVVALYLALVPDFQQVSLQLCTRFEARSFSFEPEEELKPTIGSLQNLNPSLLIVLQ